MPTWNLEVPDRLLLDLKLPVGRVDVTAAPAGTATVELAAASSHGEQFLSDATVEVRGDRLVVHLRERGTGRGWLRLRTSARIHARIAVPAGTAIDADVAAADLDLDLPIRALDIRSASGDLRCGDVDGPVSVSSASGDVMLGDIAGDARVATASGDLRLGAIDGTASLRAASGDIEVRAFATDARARSVSGDLLVHELCGGDVDLASTSGDLRLGVAPGLQIHLDVSSVSGDLRSDLGQGDEGSGGVDLSLRARTVSGDITINRTRSGHAAYVI